MGQICRFCEEREIFVPTNDLEFSKDILPPIGYKYDELCIECFHQVYRQCRNCGRYEAINHYNLCDNCFNRFYPEHKNGLIINFWPKSCAVCGEYGATFALVLKENGAEIPVCARCTSVLEAGYEQSDWHYD